MNKPVTQQVNVALGARAPVGIFPIERRIAAAAAYVFTQQVRPKQLRATACIQGATRELRGARVPFIDNGTDTLKVKI